MNDSRRGNGQDANCFNPLSVRNIVDYIEPEKLDGPKNMAATLSSDLFMDWKFFIFFDRKTTVKDMQEWQTSGIGILHLRMRALGCFLVLVLGRRNFHTRM